MTNDDFFEFCVSISRELAMNDIFFLAQNNEIILQDVRIGLYYLAETDCVMSCFADVGYLDNEIRPEIFETILSINLEMNGMNGESLGFDRDTGHLILRAEIQLENDAAEVAEYLSEYADFAKDLRALIGSKKNLSNESSEFFIDTLA